MTDTTTVLHESDYQLVVVPEVLGDGSLVYVANHPELRGCRAQAETPEVAKQYLAEVFERYVQHFAENQLELPKPVGTKVREAVWFNPPSPRHGMGIEFVQTIPTMGITQPQSLPTAELSKTR